MEDTMNESILDQRTRRLAARVSVPEERTAIGSVVLVEAGTERIGIPVTGLREIVRPPPIVALPGMPRGMPGIVQLRGELMTVLDLAPWLGIARVAEPHQLAVVEGAPGSLGLLVGAVLGFREVFRDELAPLGHTDDAPLAGRTADLVIVLDLPRLFAGSALRVGGRLPASGEGGSP
jgi:purine-binding chemotaxis protein CheW